MDRISWTIEEDAVAVMLSMWGITPETIAQLLTNKRAAVRGIQEGVVAGLVVTTPQYERTTHAVQSRLARIRRMHTEIWSNEESWNRDAVHAFLENSLLDRDLLRNLLTLTPNDIDLIIQVWSRAPFRGTENSLLKSIKRWITSYQKSARQAARRPEYRWNPLLAGSRWIGIAFTREFRVVPISHRIEE